MGRVNLLIENIFVVIKSLIIIVAISFFPIVVITFEFSDRDVLKLESIKYDIEMRLESESPVVRSIAKKDANSYNHKVLKLQKDNKRTFIGGCISDAVDALELIEL